MYDGMSRVIREEHEYRVARVNQHAWKHQGMRKANRSYRAIVAQAIRTVAERLAPAEEATGVEPATQR